MERQTTPAAYDPDTGEVLPARSDGANTVALAHIQARFVMAHHNPRDERQARARLLSMCEDPALASVAEFTFDAGGSDPITGASVRLAEAAMRAWGHLDVSTMLVSDEEDRRTIRVAVTDLQTNNGSAREVSFRKRVLRKHFRKGVPPLAEEQNTKGETRYVYRASDRDVAQLEADLVSRAKRTLILSLLPKDLIDEALAVCRRVVAQRGEHERRLDEQRAELRRWFGQLGIGWAHVCKFLGVRLDTADQPQLDRARALSEELWHRGGDWPALYAEHTGQQLPSNAVDSWNNAIAQIRGGGGGTA